MRANGIQNCLENQEFPSLKQKPSQGWMKKPDMDDLPRILQGCLSMLLRNVEQSYFQPWPWDHLQPLTTQVKKLKLDQGTALFRYHNDSKARTRDQLSGLPNPCSSFCSIFSLQVSGHTDPHSRGRSILFLRVHTQTWKEPITLF